MNRAFTYILTLGLLMIGGVAMGQRDGGVQVGGSVFGGGNLANVAGSSTVTINQANASIGEDVYGGGAKALVNTATTSTVVKSTSVTISNGIVQGDVYGGGLGYLANGAPDDPTTAFNESQDFAADVQGPVTVTISGGSVKTVFGCNNLNGAPQSTVAVTISGGSVTQDVFGGGNLASTPDNVSPVVNINGGTIGRDVYGGGALANTGGSTVNVMAGTINGDVYGGGLGQKKYVNGATTDIQAFVNGDVHVNIGTGTVDQAEVGWAKDVSGDAIINGSVYGCNNLNGSPKGDVYVDVFQTNHDATGGNNCPTFASLAAFINEINTYTSYTTGSYMNNFAIKAVYGGGNMASYSPNSNKKAQVHIYTCSNTIHTVYGGGNAANATDVGVIICGGRFDRIFGGGNGYSESGNHTLQYWDGTDCIETETTELCPDYNPGANITGDAITQIHGGLYRQLFGGSNQKGDVHNAELTIDDESDCDLLIVESFGGANEADITGDVTTTLACSDIQIGSFYGGSNLANIINGDVTLNVYGGNYTNVFGGSKGSTSKAANIIGAVTLNLYGGTMTNAFGGSDVNGNITGKITVNVLDYQNGNCALQVQNIYGGGNWTAYSPTDASSLSPEVNVMHIMDGNSITGNVYGGGKGDAEHDAVVTANPLVNIGYVSSMSTLIPDNYYTTTSLDADALKASVSGIVFGGGDYASVAGNTTVNIQKANSSASSLFGGGNQASVGGATVNVLDGSVSTGVYGGCNTSGSVGGNIYSYIYNPTAGTLTQAITPTSFDGTINVNIKSNLGNGTSGTEPLIEGIYGGGKGSNTSTTGYVTVTIGAGSTPTIYSDVYGGSALGAVNVSGKTTKVDFKNGTLNGKIYGGGMGQTNPNVAAMVNGNVVVELSNGSVSSGVYGGCNERGTVVGDIQVSMNGGQVGTGHTARANVHGGGYGNATATTGDVEVNITSGSIYGDIYGGSGFGNVNSAGDTTMVNVTGGTVYGDIYGGGLGSTQPNYAAAVNGKVFVNIGSDNNGSYGGDATISKYTVGTDERGGRVFGCNNANGSPQDSVFVNIYRTHHTQDNTYPSNINTIADLASNSQTQKYAIEAVYGGGNEAAYTPPLANGKPRSTTVHVYDCQSNTIKEVYGGGNAANVGTQSTNANTFVTIDGGRINRVFGGGKGVAGTGGVAANIYGIATTTIYAGLIDTIFGGSNQNGTITSANLDFANTGSCTDKVFNQVFGGANVASISSDLATTINCGTYTFGDIYGGSNEANITGNVNLTIEGGSFTNVFGGSKGVQNGTAANILDVANGTGAKGNVTLNLKGGTITNAYGGSNYNGNIEGKITVNVNDIGNQTCPLKITNIYGASNLAAYTPKESCRTSSPSVYIKNVKSHASATEPYNTVKGSVFGGGKGGSAIVTSNPLVVVGDSTLTSGNLASIDLNVYGGGDLASTEGSPKVFVQKSNSLVKQNVYGGGNKANVTGSTVVEVIGGTITQDVYGGGALADVGTTDNNGTTTHTVTLSNGTVRMLFGGGMGDNNTAALVNGNAIVNVSGGTINGNQINTGSPAVKGGVFGGCNERGTVMGTATVGITGAVGGENNHVNVYGGGLGVNTNVQGTVAVNVGANVYGDVYGGSAKGLVNYNYNNNTTPDTPNGNATTGVTQTGGTVYGDIYGGGHGIDNAEANVGGAVTVAINNGSVSAYGTNSANGGNVFGCNNLKGAPKDVVTVNVSSNVATNVYGGGNEAAYTNSGNYPAVNILKGTVSGSVFGGGKGSGATVSGRPTVIVGDAAHAYTATVGTNVYGGGDLAAVNGSTSVTVQQNSGTGASTAISGNVYGGGNQANVSGSTEVVMTGGTVTEDVYGGGALANVNTNTTVAISGGSTRMVFGGGMGNNSGTAAQVAGTAGVTISDNASIGGYNIGTSASPIMAAVFGGCNVNGSVGGAITLDANGGNIGGNVYGGGLGENTTTGAAVTVTVNGSSIANDVYGGSALGKVNANTDNLTKVNLKSGSIAGKLYGGGMGQTGASNVTKGQVNGRVEVLVEGGSVTDVFGCNNYNGAPQGTVKVDINKNANASTFSVGNVYGGGNVAAYGGTPAVNIKAGTVSGNVYGGGNNITSDSQNNPAGVAGSDVEMTGGIVLGGVYGGCNEKGTVTGNSLVKIYGGTVGSEDQLEATPRVVAQVFGGGLGASTKVNGDVTVNVNKGDGVTTAPTIWGDVYGGSALGSVNTSNANTTTVNIMDGVLETKTTTGTTTNGQTYYNYFGGNVFGGGLGQEGENNVNKGKVNGVVTVNIGTFEAGAVSTELGDHTGNSYSGNATIKGNVYGCNNTNGSPQQNVTVNIYHTAHNEGTNEYAIANVFGGGNLANYVVNKTATVNVFGCDNTIKRVFGGGNAAATNSVVTDIKGGHFAEVYGGGNGEVSAANINGDVTLGIHGGTVGQFFVGSNQQGSITGESNVTVNNTGCDQFHIDEFFCGGNYANIDGDVITTITCEEGMDVGDLYGGCNMADITGRVELNVYGGTYNNIYGGSKGRTGTTQADAADIGGSVTLNIYGGTVTENIFGGSNINGNIKGIINVNILDHQLTTCPLNINNVYGSGNQTPYTPDNVTIQGVSQKPISPIVNVMHIKQGSSISGNVYGGALGATATVTSNPKVTIGYDESMQSLLPENYFTTTGLTAATLRASITGNVYGGGNEAAVVGNTSILLQQQNTNVGGDIYGGGNLANVTGSTVVNITNGTVAKDVYGGGALADVNVTNGSQTTGATTSVTLSGGTVRDIYGGGLGRLAATNISAIEAKVFGPVQVTVNGGTATRVFGSNNINGAPQSTVKVDIEKTAESMSVANVYGGGNQAAYTYTGSGNYPEVNIKNGTVSENVFGGGLGNTAKVRSNPKVTVGDLSHDSYIATVSGNVYGGGSAAMVGDNDTNHPSTNGTSVLIQKSNTTVSKVFGGGMAADVTGTTTVTMNGGTINGDTEATHNGIYGGCDSQGVVGGNITVNVNGGNVGTSSTALAYVHGGGYGQSTGTSGNVDVNIAQTGATTGAVIYGDVYGGSALGTVNGTASNTTYHTNVTLNKGTIHGNLYGGGLGDPYEAKVYSPVQVAVYGGSITDGGAVYGCNNKMGAPQSTVKVDIYGTDTPSSGYALNAVFGGGNQAAYGGTPEVTIHNCNNSIGYVYGGGNKASVAATNVKVYGGNTIGYVFGGGNGEGLSATTPMVTGNAVANIYGGTIGHVFGGNNSSGTINGSVLLDVNKQAEGTGTACDMKIGEVYGGGNLAAGNAGTITIGCTGALVTLGENEHYGVDQEGIRYVYGGSNDADVTGDITLNINSGIVENVFGGNNTGHTVNGKITVNINQTNTSCGWYVGNVFGGGNLAAYNAPEGNLNYPAVNIKNGTVSGNVYGGGKGELVASTNPNHGVKGKVTGNPHVTIGGFDGSYTASVLGDVYGGGDAANVAGIPVVEVNACNTTVGDLYGGGNAADVTGTSITVNGGTISHAYGGGHGDKTVTSEPLKYANVNGDVTFNVNGGTIAQVFAGSNSKGAITGTSSLTVNKTGSCAMKLGEVYGGGNEADGNAGSINIVCTGSLVAGENGHVAHPENIGTTLEGIGKVFGGANKANITGGSITLNITSGIVRQVFGGNNTSGEIKNPTTGAALPITVNINKTGDACGWYVGDVFGGGDHAWYGGTPDVNIQNGTVYGNVYGGGNDITSDSPTTPAGVAGSDVEMTGGIVLGSVYGGCNEKGTVTTNSVVKIFGGEIGSQALLNGGTVSKVFGGGLGEATKVNGNVTVTVNKTGSVAPVIYGDVYGGSALGSVNTGSSNTTTVNILDGTLITSTGTGNITDPVTNNVIGTYTIYNGGNVFGGGLGQSGTSNVDKGKVNGVVTVNIGEKHASTTQGNDHQNYTYTGNATIQGSVYGCNNTNGSPQQDVNVNIYKTAHSEGSTGYAIANVFGGGNEANYTPANNGHKVSVNVFDCINTIGRVFGGGNAAHVGTDTHNANAVTDILGGRIGQVFGGGNGERGAQYAANVNGNVVLGVHGGTMGQLFGGSNQNGAISGSIGITVNDNGCGDMEIDEFFCGGNFVDVNGDLETDITCSDGMTVNNLYGGCNMANISGHVVLNVYGGEFTNVYGGSKGDLASLNQGNDHSHIDKAANINGYVTLNLFGGTIENAFGGSNVNGNIGGAITVNVIDKVDANCPLNVTNIYGGSNMTDYQPTSSSITSPVVNVMHVNNSIGGNVYGGSKGVEGASIPVKVKANPLVNIGYDANSMSIYVPKDINNQPIVPVPAAPNAVIVGKVFGGGDAAEVEGSTTVWMRQVGTGANTQVSQDIYGGGNLADVSGSTSVNVNGGTVTQDVYGGGALANTGGSAVTLGGGTVRALYGGGLGRNAEGGLSAIAAEVTGPVQVTVNSGTVTDVYGCNNVNGAPTSTVQVTIEKTGATMAVTNVFGGGNLAQYGGSPVVNIKNGTVSGNVYGGGNGDPESTDQMPGSTGAPTVNIGDLTPANSAYQAKVLGDVYGGGNAAKVTGNTAPTVNVLNKCNTEIDYVYGGGNAADVPATNVTIAGGTVHHDVFGGGHGDNTSGSEKAANVTGNVNVSVTGATIDRVFAGSNLNGTIGGTVTLSIAKANDANCEMKIGEVYGGGNEAAGNAGSINIGCTGTLTDGHTTNPNNIGYSLEGIGAVYGGANKADIGTSSLHSDIVVNINSGIINNVFGGNNTSGTINGTITVNINKNNNTCGWYVGNVYGGGNQADYTTPSNTQNYPVVNILNGTVSGDVFGGGLGVSGTEKGKVTGNPQITINGANAIVNGTNSGVYGGGSVAPTEGNPVVTLTTGTVANIYGGGKAASVTGATTVNVNGGTVDKTGTTDTGNVYGGCNSSGTVSSTTNVNITNGTVEGSVFGGGKGGPTQVTGKATVIISGSYTAVNGDVFGGGDEGVVNGGTDVQIKAQP